MPHPVNADRPLGDLVTERAGAARVLDRFGLDYCCHGRDTLGSACRAAGLDESEVLAALEDLEVDFAADWTALGVVELADHIVDTHHAYLWEELPLLCDLADKVQRVHGRRHAELADVQRLVHEIRDDLEPHLRKEEQVLFPAIGAIFEGQRDFPFGTVADPIRVMLTEHDRAGDLLVELRSVTDAYTVPDDGCASYRSLYERLEALEHDTHVHIHKENHRLFPEALAESNR